MFGISSAPEVYQHWRAWRDYRDVWKDRDEPYTFWEVQIPLDTVSVNKTCAILQRYWTKWRGIEETAKCSVTGKLQCLVYPRFCYSSWKFVKIDQERCQFLVWRAEESIQWVHSEEKTIKWRNPRLFWERHRGNDHSKCKPCASRSSPHLREARGKNNH